MVLIYAGGFFVYLFYIASVCLPSLNSVSGVTSRHSVVPTSQKSLDQYFQVTCTSDGLYASNLSSYTQLSFDKHNYNFMFVLPHIWEEYTPCIVIWLVGMVAALFWLYPAGYESTDMPLRYKASSDGIALSSGTEGSRGVDRRSGNAM